MTFVLPTHNQVSWGTWLGDAEQWDMLVLDKRPFQEVKLYLSSTEIDNFEADEAGPN